MSITYRYVYPPCNSELKFIFVTRFCRLLRHRDGDKIHCVSRAPVCFVACFTCSPLILFNGQRASGKRANSFWQLSPWHQLELLVCLQCWQTGKEFRLHWHSFVRVQIYYEYWLSINRTNTRSNFKSFIAQWLAHWPLESGIVCSSPAINIFLRIKLFFLFPFYFLNFEVKQCANIHWKYDNTGFAMGNKPNFFFIFQNGLYPTWGQKRHIAWLSSFLFKVQCFYRDENDLAPDDKYYLRGKKERFVALATFLKNDNSSCFWYTNSFNWKSSFCTHLF